MNLILRFQELLRAVSDALASELTQMVTRINAWASVEHRTDGTHGSISVTGITFTGSTQTTVGAAGGASALPATPTGYKVETIGGVEVVIPYYAKS